MLEKTIGNAIVEPIGGASLLVMGQRSISCETLL